MYTQFSDTSKNHTLGDISHVYIYIYTVYYKYIPHESMKEVVYPRFLCFSILNIFLKKPTVFIMGITWFYGVLPPIRRHPSALQGLQGSRRGPGLMPVTVPKTKASEADPPSVMPRRGVALLSDFMGISWGIYMNLALSSWGSMIKSPTQIQFIYLKSSMIFWMKHLQETLKVLPPSTLQGFAPDFPKPILGKDKLRNMIQKLWLVG